MLTKTQNAYVTVVDINVLRVNAGVYITASQHCVIGCDHDGDLESDATFINAHLPSVATSSMGTPICFAKYPMMANMTKPANILVRKSPTATTTLSL